MDSDLSSPLARGNRAPEVESLGFSDTVKMENEQEFRMEGKLGEEDEEGGNGGLSGRLTSSRMGNVSTTENSQMCLSLLTERSSIRYDSSMQVCVFYFYFFLIYSTTVLL